MKRMPPKLFEMIVAGFPEERAQLIFDALIHAEERGCQFVNVCLRHDIGFLFSNDRDEADSQLGKWRSLVKCDAIWAPQRRRHLGGADALARVFYFARRPGRSGFGGASLRPGATKKSKRGTASVRASRSSTSTVGFSSPRSSPRHRTDLLRN